MKHSFQQALNEYHNCFDAVMKSESKRLFEDENNLTAVLQTNSIIAAQLQHRLDTIEDSMAYDLLMKVCPQLSCPLPAVTILNFTVADNLFPSACEIPANIHLHSDPVGEENTSCTFQTMEKIRFQPIKVKNLCLNNETNHLTMTMQLFAGATLEDFDFTSLNFYLNAAPDLLSSLICLFHSHHGKVFVNWECEDNQKKYVVKSSCHNKTNLLYANNHVEHPFSHLQYLLAYPQLYGFFTIDGFSKIPFPSDIHEFSLEWVFSENVNLVEMNTRNFVLHCVPAINLHQVSLEPIKLTHTQREYPLICDCNRHDSMHIQKIEEVISLNYTNGIKKKYVDCYQTHAEIKIPSYQFLRKEKENTNDRIIINDEINNHCSITVLAAINNGQYPQQFLTQGERLFADNRIPSFLEVSMLTRPSKYQPCIFQHHSPIIILALLQWQFIAIKNHEALANLLTVFRYYANDSFTHQIAAIIDFHTSKQHYVQNGIHKIANVYHISLSEKYFLNHPDAYRYLFILHEFFCQYAEGFSAVELIATLSPSGKIIKFNNDQDNSIGN